MRAVNRRRAEGGISWECVDGGTIENIVTKNIHIVRTDTPLFLRLGDRGRVRPEEARPIAWTLRRIVFNGITGKDNGSRGSYFMGLSEKHIEDVVLRNVKIEVSATDKPVPKESEISEMAGDYPDAHMVKGPVPAYGLWARHVSGLTLLDTKFTSTTPDSRPMIKATQDTSNVCIS